jgi:hypothetical protein
VAAFTAFTAFEANYGVGVQVKIHPPQGTILSGPLHKVTEIFENISERIANHKFFSEKI